MEIQQVTPEVVEKEIMKVKERYRGGLDKPALYKLKLKALGVVKHHVTEGKTRYDKYRGPRKQEA